MARKGAKANSLGRLFGWPPLIIVRGRKLVLRANAVVSTLRLPANSTLLLEIKSAGKKIIVPAQQGKKRT